jgi:hypothetical protein
MSMAVIMTACIPRMQPLTGNIAPVRLLPPSSLTGSPRAIHFDWSFRDESFILAGEGVARLAPPDSVRLDLFSRSGELVSVLALVGDSVRVPGGTPDVVKSLLPSPPMLWAALGALMVAPQADTVVRVDGDTLRADIGRAPVWRAAFVGGRLVRLDAARAGRLRESLWRPDSAHIRYLSRTADRELRLTIVRQEDVRSFDATIWTP